MPIDFYIFPQEPDSLQKANLPIEVPQIPVDENLSQIDTLEPIIKSTNNIKESDSAVVNQIKKDIVQKRDSEINVAITELEDKNIIIKPKIENIRYSFNIDEIPYLQKETDADLAVKKNFLLNLHASDEAVIETIADSQQVKTEIKSILPNKQETIVSIPENTRLAFSQDWIIFVVIGSLGIIAWTRIFYNKYIQLIFDAGLNYQQSFKLFRENNSVYQKTSFLFNINFVLTISLFLYLSLHYFSIFPSFDNHLGYFLIISVLVAAFYLLKYVVYKILGFMLKEENATNEFLHNLFIYNKILGITLLPIVFSIPYINPIAHKWLIALGAIMIEMS